MKKGSLANWCKCSRIGIHRKMFENRSKYMMKRIKEKCYKMLHHNQCTGSLKGGHGLNRAVLQCDEWLTVNKKEVTRSLGEHLSCSGLNRNEKEE